MNVRISPTHTAAERGFTLVEVLVSLGIFAIVVTMSVGTLLVLIDANARAQAVQEAVNNVSFTLDAMVRDIRTGYAYECEASWNTLDFGNGPSYDTSDCAGESNFAFTETGGSLTGSQSSHRIGFRLNNGIIERQLGALALQPMTPNNVNISDLKFYVTGTDTFGSNGDVTAPLVTIYIAGTVADSTGKTTAFDLQTTVAQNTIDI